MNPSIEPIINIILEINKILKLRAQDKLNIKLKTFSKYLVPINLFTQKKLMEHNIHIGTYTKSRHISNANYIYTLNNKIDMINLKYTINAFKNILPMLSLLKYNGTILIIIPTIFNNHAITLRRKLKNFIYPLWIPGLLSNFKEYREQDRKNKLTFKNMLRKYTKVKKNRILGNRFKKIPQFVISLNTKHHEELNTELHHLEIPGITLQNTNHKNFNFLYTFPGNFSTIKSQFFLFTLLIIILLELKNKQLLKFLKTKKKQTFLPKINQTYKNQKQILSYYLKFYYPILVHAIKQPIQIKPKKKINKYYSRNHYK